MEISRDNFIKALISYFDWESRNAGRSPYGNACSEIVNKLEEMYRIQTRLEKGRQGVHIGHTFGPFGFEVKSEEKPRK